MVKCADCGFLATTKWLEPGVWFEALQPLREAGTRPTNDYNDYPLCFARAANLRGDALEERGDAGDQTLAVIEFERSCDEFTEWIMGFSPKEHLEMRMQERERAFQEQRLREDREWRERQEQQTLDRQQQREAQRLRWEIIVFGVIVTLVLAGSGIVAALIQRGTLF